jgi:hypothetical protein
VDKINKIFHMAIGGYRGFNKELTGSGGLFGKGWKVKNTINS